MAPRSCPVCGEEAEDYAGHLSSHSKEDVVATLLRQQEANTPPTPPTTSSFSYSSNSSQAGQGVQLVTYTRSAGAHGTSQGVIRKTKSDTTSLTIEMF